MSLSVLLGVSSDTVSGSDALSLGGLLLSVFIVASISSLATVPNVKKGWYRRASKPSFNPPDWVFGPMWTTLYLAMAVAAWLVQREGGTLLVWWIQLAINFAWSPTFFAAQALWPAFGIILALDVAVAVMMVQFFSVSTMAGWMIVPYMAWISFASALNFSIAKLNPQVQKKSA